MKFGECSIMIISPESWGTNFVSKHHYALELANAGAEVYFLDPPGKENKLIPINNNLTVIKYRRPFRGINYSPSVIRKNLNRILERRIFKAIKRKRMDIVWSFDPYRFQDRSFQAMLFIYHAVDVHNTSLEKKIASNADVIFSTAKEFLDQFTELQKPKYKINHGLARYFIDPEKGKYLTPGKDFINVAYVGNLHNRFIDKETLIRIIDDHPEVRFYFIGPYEQNNLSAEQLNVDLISFLKKRSNCILTGPMKPEQLAKEIQKFNVFLICYREGPGVSNPHKILEYLSTGKITICNYMQEYREKDHLLAMAEKNKDLPDIFSRVIRNLDQFNAKELIVARKKFALANTYEEQLNKIENILTSLNRC